jgi:hypothetical protein
MLFDRFLSPTSTTRPASSASRRRLRNPASSSAELDPSRGTATDPHQALPDGHRVSALCISHSGTHTTVALTRT